MTIVLNGNRLVLRDWRDDDLGAWRQWLLPNQRWQDLDGPYYSCPNPNQVDEMIGRARSHITVSD